MQRFSKKSIGITSAALWSFALLLAVSIWGISRASVPESGIEPVYLHKCAVCHARDGSGNTAKGKKEKVRDLRSSEIQKQTDAELTEIITNGKKKMQAYKDRLTPEQIQQLVAYVRGLSKKP